MKINKLAPWFVNDLSSAVNLPIRCSITGLAVGSLYFVVSPWRLYHHSLGTRFPGIIYMADLNRKHELQPVYNNKTLRNFQKNVKSYLLYTFGCLRDKRNLVLKGKKIYFAGFSKARDALSLSMLENCEKNIVIFTADSFIPHICQSHNTRHIYWNTFSCVSPNVDNNNCQHQDLFYSTLRGGEAPHICR